MATKGPCWDGYVQKGFKNKNGKKVPNCVPASTASSKKSKAKKAK